ncbi:MAG: tail fiber domain-containing protein [Oscillatoria sp. PMC 1051.18]|nr:tail fiber domain-containing protein [Oscillatoria sp. PMC 1050.18]MEC5028834.1 tail fiber domain-containing protein [Oscillatoria sp. PMC 1051.18]
MDLFDKNKTHGSEDGLIEELSDEMLTDCVGGTGYIHTKSGKPFNTKNKSDKWIKKKLEQGLIEYDPEGSHRSWGYWSDREIKENFANVDNQEILEKVASLPITTWNYTDEGSKVRHLGPMAQDFAATFSLGDSETQISAVDANGVALAAIQGLYQQLQEKDSQIQQLRAEINEIKQNLSTSTEITNPQLALN